MEIRAIQMLIRTLFERDSKHSDPNSNHLKRIRSIRIHILNIRKGLDANSNHSKGIRSNQMQIRTTRKGIRMQVRSFLKGFEAFECKF